MHQSDTHLVRPSRPLFDEGRLAAAGFLARYSGSTRVAYASDLNMWFAWCDRVQLAVFDVERAHLELWARELEEIRCLARATIGRRLSTVAGFYRFAVIDGRLDRSPADYVRRPKTPTDSTTLGLDRMELGAFIAQAAAAGPVDHALACLLGLLGLRVGEACGVNIEDLDFEREHRTVTVLGKGHKLALIPLPPRVGRAIDLAAGERRGGPLLLARSGRRLDRHAATRIVRRLARRAGIGKHISPHSLRHSFITAALDAGVPLRDRPDRRTPRRSPHHHPVRPGTREPRPARQLHRHRLHRRRRLTSRECARPGNTGRLPPPKCCMLMLYVSDEDTDLPDRGAAPPRGRDRAS